MPEPWDVKLDRAGELLGELRRALATLTASGDFAVTVDEAGRERVVRFLTKSGPPPRLSAIVGDFIHNLRSSLDCVMLAACEVRRPLTDKEEGAIQFPITLTPKDFKDAASHMGNAAADVKKFIREVQPWYWVVQGSNPPADDAALKAEIEHESLPTLAYLSNIDKHRRIHLTAWYPKDVYIGTPAGVDVQWRSATVPERANGEIGRWILDGVEADLARLTSNGEAGLTLQRYLDIGWSDIEVTDWLQGIRQYVEWVVGVIAVMIGRR